MSVGCLFCAITSGEKPASIVREGALTVTFLDIRPLFLGHCLVAPRRHVETLPDLQDDLLAPLFAEVRLVARALPEALGLMDGGSFVAINNRVSQSVPHLHVHVIPRRPKDGLKGFFWPRQRYRDATHEEQIRSAIADRIAALSRRRPPAHAASRGDNPPTDEP